MTALELVRLFASDPFLFNTASKVGDGVATEFQLPYFPVKPSSEQVFKNGILQVLTTDYAIDYATGNISFVTAPGSNVTASANFKHSVFSDIELQAILDLWGTDPNATKLAAADALDIMASNQALILKKMKTLEFETDGPAVAKALRESAAVIRKQINDAENEEGSIEIVEMVYDTPSWLERIIKEEMRSGG